MCLFAVVYCIPRTSVPRHAGTAVHRYRSRLSFLFRFFCGVFLVSPSASSLAAECLVFLCACFGFAAAVFFFLQLLRQTGYIDFERDHFSSSPGLDILLHGMYGRILSSASVVVRGLIKAVEVCTSEEVFIVGGLMEFIVGGTVAPPEYGRKNYRDASKRFVLELYVLWLGCKEEQWREDSEENHSVGVPADAGACARCVYRVASYDFAVSLHELYSP